ncbi:MAG TPA: hypothetical protein VII52_12835 [Gemmatimonadaceae bacterium]
MPYKPVYLTLLPHREPGTVDQSCVARVTLLLATLALAASGCYHYPSPSSPAAGQPVLLLGVPENHLIRWPSVAVRSDTVFVAANVFPTVGDSLDARPAYLGRLRQNAAGDLVALAPLALPQGDFQFAYPRITRAGGRLHLVWAEFRSPARTTATWMSVANSPTSLWHAVLDNGGWSAPERFATSEWFAWNSESGDVAVGASGTLHVVVWQGDAGPPSPVRDYRLTGGLWEHSGLPYARLNQANAIATRGDTVVIALVDGTSDPERVVVVESVDQGKHWTNPIAASSRPREQGSVSRLALAATTDGQVLAIGEKANDSFYLDTIRVLRMKGGTGPSTTRLILPPPTADGFVLTVPPCGPVVMLIRTFSLHPQLFELTLPRHSSAPVIRPLLSTTGFVTFPGVAAGRRSAIAVFSYDTVPRTPGRSAAMTLPVCSS